MKDITHVQALVDLIQFFKAGGCTDAVAVAERYGCSLRSAERYFTEIERWVPLERKRNGHRMTFRKATFE